MNRTVFRPLLRLYSVVFIVMISFSFLYLAIPLYMFSFGATQSEIGLQGLLYYGVQAPLTPLLGKFSDKLGRKRILIMGLLLNASTSLGLALTASIPLILVIGTVQGVASACYWPIMESLIADSTPSGMLGESMGLYSASFGVGLFTGPVLAGYLKDLNILLVFTMAAVFSLLPLPLLLRLKERAPKGAETEHKATGWSFKLNRFERGSLLFAGIAIFAYGLIVGGVFQIFPVYGIILGFTGAQIGLLITALNFSRIISNFVTSRSSNRFGKRVLATAGVAISSSIILVSFFDSYYQLFFALLVLGFGVGAVYPSSLALISESSPTSRGMLIGLFDAVLTVAIALGSQFSGLIADFSLTGPYLFLAGTSLTLTFILILIIKKSK
jgi:MFS transporter, DHA1 family, multidrug resistance protein